jgi:hypothetical protein
MRVLRFLQVHPYWLYKLTTALVIVGVTLTLIYVQVARNQVIIYPVIMFVLPAGIYGAFAIAALAALGEIFIDLTRKFHNPLWEHLALALVIVYGFIVGLAYLGPTAPSLLHVSTVPYDDHLYNLARETLISSAGDSSSVHIFYECDSLGIICRVVHSESLMVSTFLIERTTIELVANPDRNAISILVEGEVVYFHQF